eukprot:gb/GFBE01040262.1/.p1 GENE.gb/GFBE01040262.1/~~gb/GFBE01040262.1/.p1  ORF type:complete len:367 (+),score=63.19 gb/GFBE01040262.1/:1-1101(+)
MELPRRKSGRWKHGIQASLLRVVAIGALVGLLSPWEQIPGPAALLGRSSRSKKVLFQARGYELLVCKGKGKLPLPSLQFRKVPKQLVAFAAGGSVASSASKSDVLGFPFTTQNVGVLQISLPRLGGRLRLTSEDPPSGPAAEETPGSSEVFYEQHAQGLGEISGRVRSNGEWNVALSHEVEDIGRFRGSVNSQLDWSVDLDTTYPPVKGMTPSVTYGATQDGMRVNAKVEGQVAKNVNVAYAAQNAPGKYAPADILHDGKVKVSSGKHSVEVSGSYDRKFSKIPVRGSLSYTLETTPVTLDASVDFDKYRLRARGARGQVAAAVGRQADESGHRPAEVEVKVGKVSAVTSLEAGSSEPRIRLSLDV